MPIVVRLEDSARTNLALLERLTVPGARGPVMLGQVAALEMTGGPAVIDLSLIHLSEPTRPY